MCKSREDKIIEYLATYLKSELKPGKNHQSNYSHFPIVVPPTFLRAMHHANYDIEKIDNHAARIAEIATKYNLSLKFYEDYFLLRLNVHLDREPASIDFYQGFILCSTPFFIILIMIFIAPKKAAMIFDKFPSLPPITLPIASILILLISFWLRYIYREKSATNTLAYRYCILVLKRAQELL